jgi:hypothetical protein
LVSRSGAAEHGVFVQRNHDQIHPADPRCPVVCSGSYLYLLPQCAVNLQFVDAFRVVCDILLHKPSGGMIMEKFIPYEKLSKKEKRKADLARRQTWGALNPTTRKPQNSKAYNRKRTQTWKKELPGLRPLCLCS